MTSSLPSANIREKLLELSRGDYNLEKKLADLYFKSFQDLKDLYAASLINRDAQLLAFIHHKYKNTFHMLNLPELAKEVQSSKQNMENFATSDSLENSVTKVQQYCDHVLKQLQNYYWWLA